MNLVVMAAGMGSRFGGLKQLTPVGPHGEFLIDYSIYDAKLAGVEKVIFIIKEELAPLFKETIGKRIESLIQVEYVYQKMEDLPIKIPQIERKKPWGTGQALLASKVAVDQPFMIINADDFYGRDAFRTLAKFFQETNNHSKKHYAMIAYQLKNTLSKNGTVSRGICEVENGYLKKVTEHTKIGYLNQQLVSFTEEKAIPIPEDAPVSVNLFGFTPEIFEEASKYFQEFLTSEQDLTKAEFYLPTIVQKSIDEDLANVKVLHTTSTFGGMTYQEDLNALKEYIKKLIKEGIYPDNLWEEQS